MIAHNDGFTKQASQPADTGFLTVILLVLLGLDLEGIVAKWKHGPYVGDDVATSWVKIKNPADSQSQGRHEQFARFRHLALSQ
jgi:hypothetical protein